MPWTVDNPPKPATNWTRAQRKKCVAAANAVLRETGDEQQAIFACIHAAGKGSGDKEDTMTREYKSFSAIATKVDGDQGIVDHIVAVMGNIDHGLDRIESGAFKKTIHERAGKIRVLDSHKTDSIMRIVGMPLSMKELTRGELPAELLQKCPEATGGLFVSTQFLIDTPEGLGAFKRIKWGALNEFSIGYDALDVGYEKQSIDGKQQTIRVLKTIRLWEYSPVLWGMNEDTMTLGLKEDADEEGDAEDKAALPVHKTEMASEDTSWDGPSVMKMCKGKAQLRKVSAWVDPEGDAEDKASYKLPHHMADGKVVWNGVKAAGSSVQGSRKPVAIPEGDMVGVKRHLAAHYAQFDKTPPWSKEGKQARDFDTISYESELFNRKYRMWEALDSAIYETFWESEIDKEGKLSSIETSLRQFSKALLAWSSEILDYRAGSKIDRPAINDAQILELAMKFVQSVHQEVGTEEEEAHKDTDHQGAGPGNDPPTPVSADVLMQLIEIGLGELETLEV